MDRDYDVVLFGATGFVGRLAAERLAARPGLRWAIAGRDARALQELHRILVARDPENDRVGILVADLGDVGSLRAMAASATVLATTVGPYADGGLTVVDACVQERTHYLDLTGEPSFVRESRRRFGDAAREGGIKVVHCVGFESVPADLGTAYTLARLPSGVPRAVRCYVRARGRASGGTWASFVGALSRGTRDERVGAVAMRGRGRGLVHRAPAEVGGWAVPLPIIDSSIVRESARADPERYAALDFEQFYVVPSWSALLRIGATLAGAWVLAQTGPTRRWLLARVPAGSGPSPEVQARSWFEVTFVGEAGSMRVVTRVSGGDPGYGETSAMLVTAAVLLATRPGDLPPTHGVLTPATAFGLPLVAALQEAGIRFETLSIDA